MSTDDRYADDSAETWASASDATLPEVDQAPEHRPRAPLDGRFDAERKLGEGGMGEVWAMHDRWLDRSVAVKTIRANIASVSALTRFQREVRVLARLEHPGVVPLYEASRPGRTAPWYSMRRVVGETLTQHMDRVLAPASEDTPQALRRRVDIVVRVCEALAHAHSRGVVHRDVKADNVMIGPFGEVQLMDWGLAKVVGESEPALIESGERSLTRLGQVLGTLRWASPEQLEGRVGEHGPATDVWAVGKLLNLVCTGNPEGTGHPIPAPLASVVARCLQPAPADRPASPADVAAVLQDWRDGLDVRWHRYGLPTRARRWAWRQRVPLGLAAVTVLGVLGTMFAGATRLAASERVYKAAGLLQQMYEANRQGRGLDAAVIAAHLPSDFVTPESRGMLLHNDTINTPFLSTVLVARFGDCAGVTIGPGDDVIFCSPTTRTNGETQLDLWQLHNEQWQPVAVNLPAAPLGAALSPDGSKIAAVTGDGDLWIVDWMGRERICIWNSESLFGTTTAGLELDSVVWDSDRSVVLDIESTVVRVDTSGHAEMLIDNPTRSIQFAWGRDVGFLMQPVAGGWGRLTDDSVEFFSRAKGYVDVFAASQGQLVVLGSEPTLGGNDGPILVNPNTGTQLAQAPDFDQRLYDSTVHEEAGLWASLYYDGSFWLGTIDGRTIGRWTAAKQPVTHLPRTRFFHSGRSFAISRDNTILIYEVDRARPTVVRQSFPLSTMLRHKQHLLVSGREGTLATLGKDLKPVGPPLTIPAVNDSLVTLAKVPGSTESVVVHTTNRAWMLWAPHLGTLSPHPEGTEEEPRGIAWSPSGEHGLMWGGEAARFLGSGGEARATLREISRPGLQRARVNGAQFLTDALLFTSHWDGALTLWHHSQGDGTWVPQPIVEPDDPDLGHRKRLPILLLDGRFVAVGHRAKELLVWRVGEWNQPAYRLPTTDREPSQLITLDNGRLLVAVGLAGGVDTWKLPSFEHVATTRLPATSASKVVVEPGEEASLVVMAHNRPELRRIPIAALLLDPQVHAHTLSERLGLRVTPDGSVEPYIPDHAKVVEEPTNALRPAQPAPASPPE